MSELEQVMAAFVRHRSAVVFSMGYSTNSTTIPALVSQNDLILSDSLNHASIVSGCRTSGATVRTFKHNDMEDLELQVRRALLERPWGLYRKILIVAEGVFSMEGDICDLPRLVLLKNKYKCYLYIDEAHSIGALGATGRGVCEFWGVDPYEVDVLAGTFSKSFASVGGYVCGSTQLTQHLKRAAFGQIYDCAICPGAAQQAISAIRLIESEDGGGLVHRLRENAQFFRRELIRRRFLVCGHPESPVVPVLVFYPAKMVEFSREALKRGLAAVAVGFPATGLFSNRIRFCISAAHTKDQLEWAIKIIDELGDRLFMKYGEITT